MMMLNNKKLEARHDRRGAARQTFRVTALCLASLRLRSAGVSRAIGHAGRASPQLSVGFEANFFLVV